MAKERPGVMLYFELENALKLLNDSQRGQLLTAILEYAHYGAAPIFNDPLLDMAWSFVKSDLDRDGERYKDTVQKKRISGIISDFKRNYAPKHGISPDDEEAMHEYIRQRISTSVDECQPTTSTVSSPTTSSTTARKTTAAGKGYGENQTDTSSKLDFESLREQGINMLRGYK